MYAIFFALQKEYLLTTCLLYCFSQVKDCCCSAGATEDPASGEFLIACFDFSLLVGLALLKFCQSCSVHHVVWHQDYLAKLIIIFFCLFQ